MKDFKILTFTLKGKETPIVEAPRALKYPLEF